MGTRRSVNRVPPPPEREVVGAGGRGQMLQWKEPPRGYKPPRKPRRLLRANRMLGDALRKRTWCLEVNFSTNAGIARH